MTSAARFESLPDERLAFSRALVEHGLLVASDCPGVWGRGAEFERVVSGIERLISRETAEDQALSLRFPPVIARKSFEKSQFLRSFPHLAGSVHCFAGGDKEHQQLLDRIEDGRDWSELCSPSSVALVPAACYPVYPAFSGRLEPGGALVDVCSYCFRHEPSEDPTRMVAFRMREHVRLGTPADALSLRDDWLVRAERLFAALAVPARVVPANDPFFGRGGRFLALDQRQQNLKLELVVPIVSETSPTAVMSFNYHQDHFGQIFAIETADGATAHSACVGFGLERIALALFRTHGFELAAWPAGVCRWIEP